MKTTLLKSLLLLGATSALTLTSPMAAAQEPVMEERKIETTSPDYWGDWGIDLTAMDRDVDPGDDFFMYVNGTWFENFEIPADRSSYGAFHLLGEKSQQQTRFIIEYMASEAPAANTPSCKVAAFFNAFMDVDAINEKGMAPAEPYLKKID
ncbi:MAG: M13 family metallopeptidase N-terminal domain-containing protein, partial [Pseudomonadota bacterium]